MCSHDTLSWLENNLQKNEVIGKSVIDVGSLNVNGNLQLVVTPLLPKAYIGIDMRSGPGVDIVCRAEDLVSKF